MNLNCKVEIGSNTNSRYIWMWSSKPKFKSPHYFWHSLHSFSLDIPKQWLKMLVDTWKTLVCLYLTIVNIMKWWCYISPYISTRRVIVSKALAFTANTYEGIPEKCEFLFQMRKTIMCQNLTKLKLK